MISQSAEYALRAAVCLAETRTQPLTRKELASNTGAPAEYLSKVLQALGRAGLVRSQRGLHGGFMLTRPPEALSVLEVINAVDALQRIRRCPLKRDAHATGLCPLHQRLDAAMAHVEEAFRDCTVGELTGRAGGNGALCGDGAGLARPTAPSDKGHDHDGHDDGGIG